MSGNEVETLKVDADQFWRIQEMPRNLGEPVDAAASERLDVDKDWQVLSWLCSPVGRAEERREAALIRVAQRRGEDFSAEALKAALRQEVEAMGFAYVDPRDLPDDLVLTAIQGRRKADERRSIANLGLAAAMFGPDEVRTLSAALDRIDEAELREVFNANEMETLDLPGDWKETELDEFYLPQLRRLKTLYGRAARAGQYVLVVMS